MKLKLISIFLSLVLSIQLLPVTQIGSMLYQNQLTEELAHSDTKTPVLNLSEELHKHFTYHDQQDMLLSSKKLISTWLHYSERLMSRLSDDVQTQPPDC